MEKSSQNSGILETRIGKSVIKTAPRISVVVPAYNVAAYIAETLASALAQTFTDYEIIVVNDGSDDTEQLEKVLAPYFDKIVYIRQENGGASVARNTAIENARGEFIAFLDGDDIWFPEKLDSQIKFLEKRGFEMVYCDALLFGEPLFEATTFMDKSPSRGEVTPESLLSGECNVITSGTIVRKDLIVKYGLFDRQAPRAQDFIMWFRLCKNRVKIGYQTIVLLKYRVRVDGLTGNSIEKRQRDIIALQKVKDRNEFTESEYKAWEKSLKMSESELNTERGKYNLVNGNFAEARKNFAEANVYQQKFKLKIVSFLLALNPQLALALFKRFRSTQLSYISPELNEKQNDL